MLKALKTSGLCVFAFSVVSLLSSGSVGAQAVELDGFNFNVGIFSDDDSSATQEPEEAYQANWDVVFYDSEFNQIFAALSTAAVDTHLVPNYPSYICIQPQDGWILTAPVSGIYFPSSTWDCHVMTDSQQEVYLFGVFPSPKEVEETPEDLGEVVMLQNNTPGEVLGETTDGEVLAATGDPVMLAGISGIFILVIALVLGQKKLILKR